MNNTPVKAGFPNPAEDAGGFALDLNDYLVKHPVSTYYLRIDSHAMADAGITPGDIVVVDRSLQMRPGDIVVAAAEGEFVIRRLHQQGPKAWLAAERAGYHPIPLGEESDTSLWGVVTFVIHKTR